MTAMQRNKGAAAEREVARLIRDWLGLQVRRNWQGQAAQGGADLTGIPGWAVEIKRAAEYRPAWWDQTERQADLADQIPALVYLIDNSRPGQHPLTRWRVILPLRAVCRWDVDEGLTAEISLRAWIQILRESIPDITETQELPQ